MEIRIDRSNFVTALKASLNFVEKPETRALSYVEIKKVDNWGIQITAIDGNKCIVNKIKTIDNIVRGFKLITHKLDIDFFIKNIKDIKDKVLKLQVMDNKICINTTVRDFNLNNVPNITLPDYNLYMDIDLSNYFVHMYTTKYLIDCLKSINTPIVKIYQNSVIKGAIITNHTKGDDDFIQKILLMPAYDDKWLSTDPNALFTNEIVDDVNKYNKLMSLYETEKVKNNILIDLLRSNKIKIPNSIP